MATRQKKLEKHRRRRQEKQRQVRVAQNHRIQDYLSDRHEVYACYANAEWSDAGMASILLARNIAPGMVSFAAFLVDYWGMGLKDAWGETAISKAEFDDKVEHMRAGIGAMRIDLSTVKHLVFGGIEVARKLEFRLPKNYERWTRLIGPLPPGEKPDLSLFGKDGKTHIWCSERDLELRYLGDPKKLLNRPNIEFVIRDGSFTLWDDEGDDADDEDDLESQVMDGSLVDTVHDWCAREKITPSPILQPLVNAMRVSSEDVLDEIVSTAGPDGGVVMSPVITPDSLIRRTMTQMRIMGYDERDIALGFTQILGAMRDDVE